MSDSLTDPFDRDFVLPLFNLVYPHRKVTPRPQFNVDISLTNDSYFVTADLPGMNKKDILVSMDISGNLTISAKRDVERTESGRWTVLCERIHGSFTRTIRLEEPSTDSLVAKYDNGVLTITIPKRRHDIQQVEVQ